MGDSNQNDKKDLKSLFLDKWNKYKALIVSVGILALIAKFKDLLIDYMIQSARKDVEKAKKQDGVLKSEAEEINKQANKLVEESNQLSENKEKVDEDWHKK